MDPGDDDGRPVDHPVLNREADWRAEAARLGGESLLERLRIGKRNRTEASALVKPQDDQAAAGKIRQGAEGRRDGRGEAPSCRLDLY